MTKWLEQVRAEPYHYEPDARPSPVYEDPGETDVVPDGCTDGDSSSKYTHIGSSRGGRSGSGSDNGGRSGSDSDSDSGDSCGGSGRGSDSGSHNDSYSDSGSCSDSGCGSRVSQERGNGTTAAREKERGRVLRERAGRKRNGGRGLALADCWGGKYGRRLPRSWWHPDREAATTATATVAAAGAAAVTSANAAISETVPSTTAIAVTPQVVLKVWTNNRRSLVTIVGMQGAQYVVELCSGKVFPDGEKQRVESKIRLIFPGEPHWCNGTECLILPSRREQERMQEQEQEQHSSGSSNDCRVTVTVAVTAQ